MRNVRPRQLGRLDGLAKCHKTLLPVWHATAMPALPVRPHPRPPPPLGGRATSASHRVVKSGTFGSSADAPAAPELDVFGHRRRNRQWHNRRQQANGVAAAGRVARAEGGRLTTGDCMHFQRPPPLPAKVAAFRASRRTARLPPSGVAVFGAPPVGRGDGVGKILAGEPRSQVRALVRQHLERQYKCNGRPLGKADRRTLNIPPSATGPGVAFGQSSGGGDEAGLLAKELLYPQITEDREARARWASTRRAAAQGPAAARHSPLTTHNSPAAVLSGCPACHVRRASASTRRTGGSGGRGSSRIGGTSGETGTPQSFASAACRCSSQRSRGAWQPASTWTRIPRPSSATAPLVPSGARPAFHRSGCCGVRARMRSGEGRVRARARRPRRGPHAPHLCTHPSHHVFRLRPLQVISQHSARYRGTHAAVGKVRARGASNAPAGQRFGLVSDVGGPGAVDLLRGSYTVEQQQPDADLGRAVRPGFRNVASKAPAGHSFGVASAVDGGSTAAGCIRGL